MVVVVVGGDNDYAIDTYVFVKKRGFFRLIGRQTCLTNRSTCP